MKSQFRETEVGIPDAFLDRVLRTGPNYLDKSSNKKCINVVKLYSGIEQCIIESKTILKKIKVNIIIS